MKRWLGASLFSLLLGMLSSCTIGPTDHQAALTVQQDQQAIPTHWRVDGRLAITTPDGHWSFEVHWSQQDQAYTMDLVGPMGQGSAHLQGEEGHGIQLTTAKGEIWTAETPEQLWQQQMGWPLPLSGLRFWVLGMAQPGTPVQAQEFEAGGRYSRLVQAGWEISYRRYQLVSMGGENRLMPVKIFLVNDTLEIRMIIHRWQLL